MSSYRQSAKFKLQCVLLECIGGVVCTQNLPPAQFEQGLVVVTLYLSSEQPRPLQTQSCQCIAKLITVDSDLVWLVLRQLVPPTPALVTPASYFLKPYKFPDNPESAKYAENVEPLILLTFRTPFPVTTP